MTAKLEHDRTNDRIGLAFQTADQMYEELRSLAELLAARGWEQYALDMNRRSVSLHSDLVLWLTELTVALNVSEHAARTVSDRLEIA